jgi:hypothetical protein
VNIGAQNYNKGCLLSPVYSGDYSEFVTYTAVDFGKVSHYNVIRDMELKTCNPLDSYLPAEKRLMLKKTVDLANIKAANDILSTYYTYGCSTRQVF